MTRVAGIPAPLSALNEGAQYRAGADAELTGSFTLQGDESWIGGHFPGQPMYPGVFVLETVRQAMERTHDVPLVLTSIRSVRFYRPLLVGETLLLDAAVEGFGPWRVRGRTSVGTERMASFDVVLAIPEEDVYSPGAENEPAAPVSLRGVPSFGGVLATLPQRWPLLLVDGVEDLVPGRSIRTRKVISACEPWFVDLEGNRSVFPHSLLLESFGQSAALLWLEGAGAVGPEHVLMFAAARGCDFLHMVEVGAVVHHEVMLEAVVADTAFVTGRSLVGKTEIATFGSLMAVRRPVPKAPETKEDMVSASRNQGVRSMGGKHE